ncbi:BCL2 modifying factor 2 [Neoarius graeffei]|uniref:BCL2 modifying factor 2 n=1 Tax=Neoarius graeffei TaxID=443677 RepID=UPI00298CC3B0|nr:BCL2 modifying factor 2 [Neoarius graeffei]
MEDDEEDTPLPSPANRIEVADTRRGNMPVIQTTPRFRNSGSISHTISALHRSLHGAVGLGLLSTPSDDSQALLHNLIFFPGGDSGFTAHVPSVSEESGEEEQQDDEKRDEREEDRTSVEVQIGRKLREIGDHFQQEHMQLFLQYRRNRQPIWWRLATTLYDFLFPRELIGH